MLALSESTMTERVCHLVTTGRVTGTPHQIEIWFAADPAAGDVLYLLAGGRDRADWVRNIRRDGRVSVIIRDRRYHGTARILTPGDETDRRAREVVATKYQGWRSGQPFSQWARDSLAVSITLEGASV
jgi:deazaflavin-dependent oxidoreductase (nitroreductase family)